VKVSIAMNGQGQRQIIGMGWIVLLVLIHFVLNLIPNPIDDAIVATIGGYQALKRLGSLPHPLYI
jgi:hypothetical protein